MAWSDAARRAALEARRRKSYRVGDRVRVSGTRQIGKITKRYTRGEFKGLHRIEFGPSGRDYGGTVSAYRTQDIKGLARRKRPSQSFEAKVKRKRAAFGRLPSIFDK